MVSLIMGETNNSDFLNDSINPKLVPTCSMVLIALDTAVADPASIPSSRYHMLRISSFFESSA